MIARLPILKFFALILLFIVLAAPLTPEDVIARRSITYGKWEQKLQEIAEGKPYAFVPVGRSLTALHAYLTAKGTVPSKTLPLSEFRYRQAGHPPLTKREREKLFEHFDRFLPTDEELKGKTLLVGDYANEGYTISAVKEYLTLYLEARNRKVNVKYVGFWDPASVAHAPNDVSAIKLSRTESDRMGDELYERYSDYGEYDVQKTYLKKLAVRPEFQTLVNAFKKKLKITGCAVPLDGIAPQP